MRSFTNPLAGRNTGGPGGGDIGYDYRRIVGAYLAEHRKKAGLTQVELARMLGLRDTAISAIEVGRNSLSPERFEETADALHLDRKKFGKFLLRYYNPWLFALLYPTELNMSELKSLPQRVADHRPRGTNDGSDIHPGRR